MARNFKLTIKLEWRVTGPAEAKELLKNNTVNRKLKPGVVSAYAEDMIEKLFRTDSGQAIILSRTGRVLDGQHRLNAIIESGATLELMFITGIPDDAQEVMDQGPRRSVGDVLGMAEVSNAVMTGSVARWLLLAGEPGPGFEQALKKRASTPRIKRIVEQNPDVVHAAARWSSMRNHIHGSPTAICYAWLWMHRVDAAACEEFFGALVDQFVTSPHDPRRAVWRALDKMDREEGIGSASKDKALATLSVLTRGWNTWRKGEELDSIPIKSRGKIIPPEMPI